MNIILTGSRGLIGDALGKRLEEEGHKLIGLDIKDGQNILEIDKIEIKEKIDMIIHTAAHCKINQSITNPELNYINNVEGTFRVLEFCRKNRIKRIVYLSSSRVLSKEKNPYTSGKIYGEELCKAYKQCYDIDYLIIRPSTVYGPFPDRTKRLIHLFITKALIGKDLEIYGDPRTKTLDFTYIDDFVEGVIISMNNPEWNKEFNISGEEESNIYELARFIIKETGRKSRLIICDPEIAQPQQVKIDNSAINNLGYKPRVTLLEGVKKTIEWYKDYLKENQGSLEIF